MALKPQPNVFIVTCVPSPQSINSICPLSLASMAVKKRLGIGIIPPVPSKQISNIILYLLYHSFVPSFIKILMSYDTAKHLKIQLFPFFCIHQIKRGVCIDFFQSIRLFVVFYHFTKNSQYAT